MLSVRKRDGRSEAFQAEKIERAVRNAGGSDNEADAVASLVKANMSMNPREVNVDEVHDMVERVLCSTNTGVAKAYILFRQTQKDVRAERLSPEGGAVASYIDASKYCRWREDLGRRESWEDACVRNMEMHVRRYPQLTAEIQDAYNKYVIPKIVVPSMRSMQFGGEAVEVNHARLYNCSFSLCDRHKFFSHLFFLLLSGCGVGYSVQRQHVMRLPILAKIGRSQVAWFTVPDTIEGWADAVKVLVESYMEPLSEYYGKYVEFLYHGVRLEGIPLRTSGGKAPGHVPLKIGVESVRAILEGAAGRQMRSIECHDICCHIALAVLSGGIRRSSLIALFSPDDAEMREAKSTVNFAANPHRRMANNSAVFLRDNIEKDLFNEVFRVVREMGEPGFYFTNHPDHGPNPCGEIGMDPVLRVHAFNPTTGFSFCNLSEINATMVRTADEFLRAAQVAALLGTLQAGYTDFPYLGEVSEQIVRRDALIGVSISGVMDNELVRDPTLQDLAARFVVEENERVAGIIGINTAARTTTMKPSGTASLSFGGIGSGHHAHHAPRYFRRITANPLEPVFQMFRHLNPHMCEEKADGDFCIVFPVESPPGALTNDDIHGVEFIDAVLSTYRNWICPGTVRDNHGLTHNVSCTVLVHDDEWDAVRDHIWANRSRIAAMALSPRLEETAYQHLPRQAVRGEVDEARWNELIRKFRNVRYDDVRGDIEYGSACEGSLCAI